MAKAKAKAKVVEEASAQERLQSAAADLQGFPQTSTDQGTAYLIPIQAIQKITEELELISRSLK